MTKHPKRQNKSKDTIKKQVEEKRINKTSSVLRSAGEFSISANNSVEFMRTTEIISNDAINAIIKKIENKVNNSLIQ